MSASMTETERLRDTALFLHGSVADLLSASLLLTVASAWFYQHDDAWRRVHFRTNPANTRTYRALDAFADLATMTIAECLKDEHDLRLRPTGIKLAHEADLMRHRDAIGHPMTVKWKRPAAQVFFDNDRRFKDDVAALVWGMKDSLNDHLARHGLPRENEHITVHHEHAMMVHTILAYSMLADAPARVPPVDRIMTHLASEAPKYEGILSKRSAAHVTK